MEPATRVQILDETVCFLLLANILENGMDQGILPLSISEKKKISVTWPRERKILDSEPDKGCLDNLLDSFAFFFYYQLIQEVWGYPRGVMVKAMDYGIVVSEFVLQSCYYVHFRTNTLGKGMNPLILPAMG